MNLSETRAGTLIHLLCRENEETGKAAWRGQPAIGTCRAASRSGLDEVRSVMNKHGIGSPREAGGPASDLFLHVLSSNVAEESVVPAVKTVFSVYLRGLPSETVGSCPL